MKYIFPSLFAVMALLSVVAWLLQPSSEDDRIELVWCSDDNPVRHEQIRLFNELYPKYHLRLDPQNQGMEKVIVQCLAGVGPDLFDCFNGFDLAAYIRSGIALDVTDMFPDYGIDPDAVWPCLKTFFQLDGRSYGFPDNAGANAVWYNKRLFDRQGLPYPTDEWTWDEFIEIAKKLTLRNENGQPEQFGLIGYWDWQGVLYQWGARIYTPEGTRCALDSPEAAEAMQFMQDLVHVHGIIPNPDEQASMASMGGWGTGEIALFGAERAAMAIGGRWWLCILRNEDYAHLQLGAVLMPKGPSQAVHGSGRATLVNSRSKNIDGAMCFLQYMHSEHWNNLINRQADALAPVMKYNYTPEFEHNPERPEEDYNVTWRKALETSIPQEVCPYVNGQTVYRILETQTDLVRAGVKSGEEGVKEAARRINRAIVEQLELDPVLREQYMEAVANGAPPAWDSEEEAPRE